MRACVRVRVHKSAVVCEHVYTLRVHDCVCVCDPHRCVRQVLGLPASAGLARFATGLSASAAAALLTAAAGFKISALA